jgi:isocitrate/isopropylmalate dehydrogenase
VRRLHYPPPFRKLRKGYVRLALVSIPSHSLSATDKVWRGVHSKLCVSSCPHIYYRSFPLSQVTLIPGDGIGQEITESVKEIFESVNAPIEWEQYDVSGMSSSGEALFKQAMESLKRNKVGLKGLSFVHFFILLQITVRFKGILFTPISKSGHISWNVAMRQQLDIYASVVLCKSLPGVPTRHSDVDFAIIRENTEGEYSGLEHQSYPGVVESLKVSTRPKAERISRFAFDFALRNGRKVRNYQLCHSRLFLIAKSFRK